MHVEPTTLAEPAPSELAISMRGVERHFAQSGRLRVHALGPVDLDIGSGEFVSIVGPSGCGKSTLLRVIAGLVAPSRGEVDVNVSTEKRAPIAMVFQDYGIYPWKTVLGNVQFPLQVNSVPRGERKERAMFWIDRLGLGDFANAYPDTLSGGMRQRVGIARAFALEPEILLMDEPFAALDAQLREVLQDELLGICQSVGLTVAFVTHSLEEALILGDRVVVFSARPGVILESITVPFPRPRSGEVRDTPEFGALRAALWQLLRGEIEPSTDRRGDS